MANHVNPDQIPHSVASDHGLNCLLRPVCLRVNQYSSSYDATYMCISDDEGGPPLSNRDVKNLVILTELPFVVAFEERVKVRMSVFTSVYIL